MRNISAAIALVLLAGCNGNTVQTSSGAGYVAAVPEFNTRNAAKIDQAVLRAAKVEPLLRFPARIGIARIDGGWGRNLTTVPPREADFWIDFAKSHPEYGTFEQVSPLVAQLARAYGGDEIKTVVDQIRMAAARQHLDAVLIYSVANYSSDTSTPLSVANLTIVGAYLMPSHGIEGEAVASALFLDVRNGYPYGTATGTGKESGFVPSIGSEDRVRRLTGDAAVTAVANLAAEVNSMMKRLSSELAEKQIVKPSFQRGHRAARS